MAAPLSRHQVNMRLLSPKPSIIHLAYCVLQGPMGAETEAVVAAAAGDAPGQGSNDTKLKGTFNFSTKEQVC